MYFIDGTRFLEILAAIVFLILLVAAILMLVNFYICDSYTCKAFTLADKKGPPGTKANVLALLHEFYNDGMWPIPYIGAAILTPLCLWFLSIPMTIKTFAIMFFTSFVVIYFIISFFGHHYINPITNYTSEYIQENCPASGVSQLSYEEVLQNEFICEQEKDEIDAGGSRRKFESFTEGFGITFATPVNVF